MSKGEVDNSSVGDPGRLWSKSVGTLARGIEMTGKNVSKRSQADGPGTGTGRVC